MQARNRIFAQHVIAWQKSHGRHDLPWQGTRDPYRIWLSEIMLQQTQVATVIAYYQRFLERFPALASLAAADLEDVLKLWSGLGYYSRARNLHRCAIEVMDRFHGEFPRRTDLLMSLPGIGRSTAAAIASLAFGKREAILDGNVKRVLCRHFGIEGFPGEAAVEARLWTLAERELPASGIETYTQGLMDLGATLCSRNRPRCERCAVHASCVANATGRVASLPTPRPRKVAPVRSAILVVLRRGGEVLLQKRPPTGIWGGLWSLPEVPVDVGASDPAPAPVSFDSIGRAAAADIGLDVAGTEVLEPFVHAFSHYKLNAQPVLVDVIAKRGARRGSSRSSTSNASKALKESGMPPAAIRVEQPGGIWLSLADVTGAALPRPIKTLLMGLASRP